MILITIFIFYIPNHVKVIFYLQNWMIRKDPLMIQIDILRMNILKNEQIRFESK